MSEAESQSMVSVFFNRSMIAVGDSPDLENCTISASVRGDGPGSSVTQPATKSAPENIIAIGLTDPIRIRPSLR